MKMKMKIKELTVATKVPETSGLSSRRSWHVVSALPLPKSSIVTKKFLPRSSSLTVSPSTIVKLPTAADQSLVSAISPLRHQSESKRQERREGGGKGRQWTGKDEVLESLCSNCRCAEQNDLCGLKETLSSFTPETELSVVLVTVLHNGRHRSVSLLLLLRSPSSSTSSALTSSLVLLFFGPLRRWRTKKRRTTMRRTKPGALATAIAGGWKEMKRMSIRRVKEPTVSQWWFVGGLMMMVLTMSILIAFFSPNSPLFLFPVSTEEALSWGTTYRETAEQSLKEMRSWRASHGISHPFFSFGTSSSLSSPDQKKVSPHTLCVGLVSVRRPNTTQERYLTTTVTALLSRTPQDADVKMAVFNVDKEAPTHLEAENLTDVVTVIRPVLSSDLHRHALKHKFLKEAADYSSSLSIFLDRGCQQILMLEDDALVAVDWLPTLIKAITQLKQFDRETIEKILNIKLFSYISTLKWRLDKPFTFLLFPSFCLLFSFLILSVVFFFSLLGIAPFPVRSQDHEREDLIEWTKRMPLILKIVVVIVVGLSMSIIQRPALMGWDREGIHLRSPRFSSVANLFVTESSARLYRDRLDKEINRFVASHTIALDEEIIDDPNTASETDITPKDLITNMVLDQNGMIEPYMIPSLFQHIGIRSSFGFKTETRSFISPFFPSNSIPILFDPLFFSSPSSFPPLSFVFPVLSSSPFQQSQPPFS